VVGEMSVIYWCVLGWMLSLTFLDDGGVSKESALCLDGWSSPSSRVRSTLSDILVVNDLSVPER